VSAAYPYRGGDPGANALATTDELAAELDATFAAAEPGTIAAFVAEPIVGATLGAVVPPDGYWPAIADICRRHGVLLIADEVMTGFGRTGRWFGVDHWGVRPDILVAAKGATSGYWPFGFAAATGEIHDTVREGPGFVHGFTYSHAPVGAAVARQVLRILEDEALVQASATKGDRLRALATDVLADNPAVGDVRGRGLMVGIELVADRATRAPFPRAAKITEAVVRAARQRGVLLYSGTGNANGMDGDTILLGPPFIVTDGEMARIVEVLTEAIDVATAAFDRAAASIPS
jgi:adenosylmethionine-8-amino-7-oxononanoate aminotransferase